MTLYYGVVGNRDHIKIDGEKEPFYRFLNVQPDGWLTSLTYAKNFHRPPHSSRMIFDCGAWSYRDKDDPGVSVVSVINDYTSMCNSGDLCVAPDHMLLPGCDVVRRQAFNDHSAKSFIEMLPKHLTPMAIVHGMDEHERVQRAEYLVSIGYKHIGIGGIAARASSPKHCIEVVRNVRAALPGIYLHVMGLSSPNYYAEWERLGVDSCDGSSHFKQAFTGGAFFSLDWNGKLVKHQAARRDNDSVIPDVHCDCLVCETLRGQGIDTRSYGSNENNMGRAVHNMNMLMLAQAAKSVGIRFLVSCVSEKRATRSKAEDLYTSTWFKKARAMVEDRRWHILSAKHGLLHPETFTDPYDATLGTNSKEWAAQVAQDVISGHRGEAVFILAGTRYRKHLAPILHSAGIPTYSPLSGLGIGQQLAAMTASVTQWEMNV